MSLYDGLSVETAPLTDLALSTAAALSQQQQHQSPEREKKPKIKQEKPPIPSTIQTDESSKQQQTKLWSESNMKLMASQMMRQQMATKTRGRGSLRGRGKLISQTAAPPPNKPFIASDLVEDDLAGEIQDEYDPLLPNSYEEIKRLEAEREELEVLRDKEIRKKHYQLYASLNEEEEKEEERRKKKRNEQQMAAIPPPSFAPPPPDPTPKEDQTEEGRIRLALEELSKIKAPRANPYAKKNFKTSAVASNIMTKYGWQEGQGLGKESQGISTALAVEKTSIKGGKIVNIAAERELMIEEDKKKVKTLTNIMKNPTKVILLENMVGPGEVDDDLQPEVIEECSKYGEIINCLIYEIPEGASDDEAVRIFVEFTKMDSAIKAVIDLNNRYFGGRTVRASFYSEDKFSKFDLAPETGTE